MNLIIKIKVQVTTLPVYKLYYYMGLGILAILESEL